MAYAFHGRDDKTFACEETEYIVKMLKAENKEIRFTAEPNVGHWIHWLVYPNPELYDWFLKHHK